MKFIGCFFHVALILFQAGYSATVITLEDERSLSNKKVRRTSKQELLIQHLPLQIEALQGLQGTFQAVMDAQKEINPVEAFKAACSLANLQMLIASTRDVLACLLSREESRVSIGVGAAPAIKGKIDQLVVYLEAAGVGCNRLKDLAQGFKEITADIFNPKLPVD